MMKIAIEERTLISALTNKDFKNMINQHALSVVVYAVCWRCFPGGTRMQVSSRVLGDTGWLIGLENVINKIGLLKTDSAGEW